MTAKREAVTSPSGERYDWTSCLITSTPSYTFQYGYLEERAILPAERGFWPAFWTWQAPDVDQHIETDVYEFYSDNRRRLTSPSTRARRAAASWTPAFDPADGLAHLRRGDRAVRHDLVRRRRRGLPDRRHVGRVDQHHVEPRGVREDPARRGTDSAVKRVDYIRAWEKR